MHPVSLPIISHPTTEDQQDEEHDEDDDDPAVATESVSHTSSSIPSFFEAEAMVNQLQHDVRCLLERFGQAMRNQRLRRPAAQSVLTKYFAPGSKALSD